MAAVVVLGGAWWCLVVSRGGGVFVVTKPREHSPLWTAPTALTAPRSGHFKAPQLITLASISTGLHLTAPWYGIVQARRA